MKANAARKPPVRSEALVRRKTEIPASQRLLTKHQVADIFGVSWRTVNRWVASGRLKAIRAGTILRFDPVEVERFKASAAG